MKGTSFLNRSKWLCRALPCLVGLAAACPGLAQPCPDLTGDRWVTFDDITHALTHFNSGVGGDADLDGDTDFDDIVTLIAFFGRECDAMSAKRLVVFGDSLSDVGRHFASYGTPAAPNFEGRYSDGPVWVEYFGQGMGLESEQIKNYAMGGATTGVNNTATEGAFGLRDEIHEFVLERAEGAAFAPDALYVLWIGANDFEMWKRTGQLTQVTPDVLIRSAISNISWAVRTLANNGAEHIVVANLPNLGIIPKVTAEGDPAQIGLASAGSIMFNTNLAWELAQLHSELDADIMLIDNYSLFEAVALEPGAFGFADVASPCWTPSAPEPCPFPAEFVFWDQEHPTTAAHQLLAEFAQTSIQAGGAPLPLPDCAPSEAWVEILTRSGNFESGPTTPVTGVVHGMVAIGDELWINGVHVSIDPGGAFNVDVPIESGEHERPIVAELRRGSQVLDRDRIVVFRGAGLAAGETVHDAVLASVNGNAIPSIRDELIGRLTQANAINIWDFLPNPLVLVNPGGTGYDVVATSAGYSCSTVDAELHDDFTRFRFAIHDVRIDYHVHAWWEGPDPGFDCDGALFAANIGFYVDVAVRPATAGSDGEIDVALLGPIQFDLVHFSNDVTNCDLDWILPTDQWVEQLAGSVEPQIRQAIRAELDEFTLASSVEEMFAALSVSGDLGAELDVLVSADIEGIEQSAQSIDVSFSTALDGPNPAGWQTLATSKQPLGFNGLAPLSGEPYGLAAGVSLATLNQLFLARAGDLIPAVELASIDIGSGPNPVTAGLLSSFVPSLGSMDPQTPYILRVVPMTPPMLTGNLSERCDQLEIVMADVRLEIVPAWNASAEPDLAISLDLRTCAALGYNGATTSLRATVQIPEDAVSDAVIVSNRVCADEVAIGRILQSVFGAILTSIGDVSVEFPIPDLQGLDLDIHELDVRNGYVTLYFDLASSHRRPDLAVLEVAIPASVDVGFPFSASYLVKNVGGATASFGCWMGASLSLDSHYLNGEDVAVTQAFVDLASDPLLPGESRWFSMQVPAMPWAAPASQTLFITADNPQIAGGGGMLCESNERNNHVGASVFTTTADAWVSCIEAPTGVVGGVGPKAYQVCVGRSAIGVDNMLIPIRVTVGVGAGSTWGDASVWLGRGQETTITVMVPTPGSIGSPGQSNSFAVRACANLAVDANRSNDCLDTTVSIAVPYWDIRLSITNNPASARRCFNTGWRVVAKNHGNVWSAPICNAQSGIGRYSGQGNWGSNLGLNVWSIPALAPSASDTHVISNYQIGLTNCFNVLLGTQYIKAEIPPGPPCGDAVWNGNYAERSIQITQ